MKIKVFVIDPFTCQIREEEVKQDSLDDLYRLGKFSCFCIGPYLPNGDVIYVDDEGLMKPHQRFFLYEGYSQPLAGIGILVGTNLKNGESVSAKTTMDELRDKIYWPMDLNLLLLN